LAVALPPPASPSMTRQTALDTARVLYSGLVHRALEIEGRDVGYLAETANYWEDRLRHLMLRSDVTLPEETNEAFSYLTSVVTNPRLDQDALLRWIDAYPEAVVDLFPPSLSTFSVLAGHPAQPVSRRNATRLRVA
jgi:hypothetical protein